MGKYQEALAIFKKLLEKNPDRTDFHYNKGLCLMRLSQYENALDCFEKVIELTPDHAYATFNTSIILSKLGRNEDARSAAEKFSRLNSSRDKSVSNSNNTNIGEAMLQMFLNNHHLAQEYFDSAIRNNPSNIYNYYLKALILLENPNNYDEAMQSLEHLLELRKDFAPADNLVAMISWIIEIRKDRLFMQKDKVEKFHSAIQQDDISSVNKMMDEGLSPYLTNEYFQSGIDLAAEKGLWDIVLLLMKKSRKITSDKLYMDIMHCCKSYGTDFASDDEIGMGLLDEHCSRLTQKNIFNLRLNNGLRYLAHLNRIAGIAGHEVEVHRNGENNFTVIGGESLEGWLPQDFLPLRIRVYFSLLVRLRSNQISGYPSEYDIRIIRHLLEEEIRLILETLHIKRDSYLIMNAPEKYRQSLIDSYTNNLAERVLHLSEGETLCINSGHRTHSLYINFIKKKNGDIQIRIDNLGDGCDRHPIKEIRKNGNLIIGRTSYLMLINANESADFLKNYFSQLFYAKAQAEPTEAFSIIYARSLDHSSYDLPAFPQQTIGNCVVENHNIGVFLRHNTRLAEWLINNERQASATLAEAPDLERETINLHAVQILDSMRPERSIFPTLSNSKENNNSTVISGPKI